MKHLKKKITPVIRELLIVFIGVFAAFWLNDYQNKKEIESQKQQIYQIVYDELDRFYIAGTEKSQFQNFTVFFNDIAQRMDSMIAVKKIPANYRIRGDYWKMDVIHSVYDSGKLADIDPSIFQELSKLKTNHDNFIAFIDEFNTYYSNHITPKSDLGEVEFFNDDGSLKDKYNAINNYLEVISSYPEILLPWASTIKESIGKRYLKI